MNLDNIDLNNLPGPKGLTRYRAERYTGEEAAARLKDFSESDGNLLRELYALLTEMRDEARAILDEVDRTGRPRMVDSRLAARWRELLDRFSRDFGTDGRSEAVSRSIYHDLRGGALPLADLRMQTMPADGEPAAEDLYSLFYALRDHLKIVRNCVSDIDQEHREHDRRSNSHSMSLLRQKWSEYNDGSLSIDFESDFDGSISSSCLEFSSLDRVLYNMINNAAQHTAGGRVRVFAKKTGAGPGGDIRFVTANRVPESELSKLVETFGTEPSALFISDFSIGGSGVGLQIVREIVANAYGLTDQNTVVNQGYVGAEIRNDVFLCWSHWPVMG